MRTDIRSNITILPSNGEIITDTTRVSIQNDRRSRMENQLRMNDHVNIPTENAGDDEIIDEMTDNVTLMVGHIFP